MAHPCSAMGNGHCSNQANALALPATCDFVYHLCIDGSPVLCGARWQAVDPDFALGAGWRRNVDKSGASARHQSRPPEHAELGRVLHHAHLGPSAAVLAAATPCELNSSKGIIS